MNLLVIETLSDFLSSQHALCRNPMTTCPEFDLLLPQKCPDQRLRRAAPLNFTAGTPRRAFTLLMVAQRCPSWTGT